MSVCSVGKKVWVCVYMYMYVGSAFFSTLDKCMVSMETLLYMHMYVYTHVIMFTISTSCL